jgi:hypothetical protein
MHHLSQTIGQNSGPTSNQAFIPPFSAPFSASFSWSGIIQALVLVRLGQELGSDSQVARAVYDLVSAILLVCR